MSVIEQYPYIDDNGVENENFVRHYSDAGKMLIQVETGNEYEDAVDIFPCPYTYIEKEDEVEVEVVDEPIPEEIE